MSAKFDSNPWLITFQSQPQATLRLICFAHAGGGASAFNTWHRQLPPHVEVWAVQLPGREARRKEAFPLELDPMMTQVRAALAPLHDRPVALFGYSLGALLAFEYARIMRADALDLTHLIVAAARAPQRPLEEPIHKLPDAAFIREIETRYDGIPRVIRDDADLLAYFLPVIRADLALRSSYSYRDQAPLACPITALGGRSDPRVTPDELGLWAAQTSAKFSPHIFPGGHFFIGAAREPALRVVAETLSGATQA